MKKKELYEKAKEAEFKTYKKIQAFVLASTVITFFINWRFGLTGSLWFIWNDIMFELGKREHTTSELETGYRPRGLKKMFLSWMFFALIAATILWITFHTPLHGFNL